MKGKWARGIRPRNFVWVMADRLAASERPGGYARTHRRIRRQEEIIWIREEGFTRVVSLLPSPHNLHAYEELGVAWEHIPFPPHEPREALEQLYPKLKAWLESGEKVLLHQEEFGDTLQGVLAGYLLYAGRVPTGHHAIAGLEHLTQRPMGPPGRQLVTIAATL
jgi:hypothetical protein